MKIFTTRARKVITFTLIMVLLFMQTGYAINKYSTEEIEAKIDKIALERGVPPVFLKAIAKIESNLQQFNSNGTPKISSNNNIGLMQVGNYKNMFDMEKLKYDIDYNINAGIDVLLTKWEDSVRNKSVSSVGNMDPNVLENWYFALWAYNGWIGRNNPNATSRAYQDKIYKICSNYYSQHINKIDTSRLPTSGKPSRGLNIATPTNTNSANMFLYSKNDLIVVNSIINNRALYDAPSGKELCSVNNDQMAKIVDGPLLKDGYYWYKIQINDKISGWIERNWIKKVGDSKYGIYPFEDIVHHWSASAVMNLYNLKLISGKTSTEFCPDENMSKEEFCVLFSKVFNIGSESVEDLRFADKTKISPWAISYIRALDEEGLLDMYGDNFDATSTIGRGEITCIIAKYIINQEKEKFDNESITLGVERTFDINKAFKISEIALPFKDIGNLQEWQINNIKIVYSKQIISGESKDNFSYATTITRGEAASVINKLYEMYK